MRRFFRCRKKEEVWRNGNITAAPFGGTDGERERQDKKDTRQLADKPSAPRSLARSPFKALSVEGRETQVSAASSRWDKF